jgi:hypothetical protein
MKDKGGGMKDEGRKAGLNLKSSVPYSLFPASYSPRVRSLQLKPLYYSWQLADETGFLERI